MTKSVKCLICGKDKPFDEIVEMYEVKGEKVYLCIDCNKKIKKLPKGDYEFNHQY